VHGSREIIEDAESLPVEERVRIVDALLRSLNPPDPDIERQWIEVAQRRFEELRSGKVKAVPGDEVMAKLRARLSNI
jgi:putative addiction module component (TIGR02574 family)